MSVHTVGAERLRTYLAENKLKKRLATALAEYCGVGRSAVSAWARGVRRPSSDNQLCIYTWTGGKVTPAHWCKPVTR